MTDKTTSRKVANARKPSNDDLWSAIRGIGMYRMDTTELEALMAAHAGDDRPFASRVIHEAARQVIASRKLMGRA